MLTLFDLAGFIDLTTSDAILFLTSREGIDLSLGSNYYNCILNKVFCV
mgnify:FL=1